MGFHTFDPEKLEGLADPSRFRYCSREELLQQLPTGPEVRLLDVGSGSGFYTDEIAPSVGEVVALDVQQAMHRAYVDRGLPDGVHPVTADADSLPCRDHSFDAAFSTMTFHESTTERSLAELYRVLESGAPAVIVDWSAGGNGESGPPVSERFDAEEARDLLTDAGFEIRTAAERSETFMIVAVRAP